MIFDITLGGAVLAGLVSFLSPCILPMVPFYLSYLAGVSVNQVADDQAALRTLRWKTLLSTFCFAAGVATVFVLLGATASVLGQALRDWFDVLRWIAAGVILIMGLHFLGVLRLSILNRQWGGSAAGGRVLGPVGAYGVGLAFAFGWTPCVGPVLAAILFLAAGSDTAVEGTRLLLAYAVGMTLPFVLAAGFIGPFLRLARRMRAHLGRIEKATGVLLVLFAMLIATNGMSALAFWMLESFEVFQGLG